MSPVPGRQSYSLGDGYELRSWLIADAPLLEAAVLRNRDHLRRWMPWVDNYPQNDAAREFISATVLRALTQGSMATGIWKEDELLGNIDYQSFTRVNNSAMIGYWLDKDHNGRGIMTRAVRHYLDTGFGRLRLNRIEIRVATGNYKSRAIPERLGFTKEGVIRQAEWLYDHYVDHVVYGMLSSEWDAR